MGENVRYILQDCLFTWDSRKAKENLKKHGVSFEEACEVFFYPYYEMLNASVAEQERWAFVGYSKGGRLLYVVAVEQTEEAWRIVSAREATPQERKRYEKENDTD
ncbi:MAG: BrnT family toxin [Thermodesulfobacteriota bacterium]